MANQQDDILSQINKSGFPFQLRVEQEVRRTTQAHGWSVASHEQPWINPDTGASGFIDIVLEQNKFPSFRLVIECKRNKAEGGRQPRWVFLLPDQELEPTDSISCFSVGGIKTSSKKLSPDGVPVFGWDDIRSWGDAYLIPKSLQSEFCILYSSEQKRQSILEGLASEVITSVEGLAQEEISVARSHNPPLHVQLHIFPVVVTNAEIAVCRFNSDQIKIADGTLRSEDVEVNIVPFIRFRKSLVTDFPQGVFNDLNQANSARQRTVVVVNAASLPEFLSEWKLKALTYLYEERKGKPHSSG